MSSEQYTTGFCVKCGVEKPRTLAYFAKALKGRKDGLSSYCRSCENAIKKASREKHVETTRAAKLAWKNAHPDYHRQYAVNREEIRCRREVRQALERSGGEADAKAAMEQYRISHRAAMRERYAKNPEKFQEGARAYYAANRQKVNAANRAYQATHRAELRAYAKANPDKIRRKAKVSGAKRKARKLALPNTFTSAQWMRCLQYWGFACAYCGKEEGFAVTIAVEHFIPLFSSECPGTVVTNMLPACHGMNGNQQSCNLSKGNRDPKLWLITKFGHRKAAKKLTAIATYFAIVAQE